MSEQEERRNTTDRNLEHAEYRGALTDVAIGVAGAATYDALKAGAHQLKDKLGQQDEAPKK